MEIINTKMDKKQNNKILLQSFQQFLQLTQYQTYPLSNILYSILPTLLNKYYIMIQIASPLINLFNDQQTYAWELLQCQVHIQTSTKVDGRDIAKLLSLYMRGVQRLNSLQDRRQIFFKNKMTSLMMKPNVVKSLSNPPKLKQSPTKIQVIDIKPSPQKKKQVIKQNQTKQIKEESSPIYHDLAKKKKQMEMHITYQSQEHTSEALNKLITQHNQKASTLNNKIEEIIQQNHKKLEQRIRQRKIKSQSARSKSERNIQEQKQSRNRMLQTIQVIKQQNEQIGIKKGHKFQRKYSYEILKSNSIDTSEIQVLRKRKRTFDHKISKNQKNNAILQI